MRRHGGRQAWALALAALLSLPACGRRGAPPPSPAPPPPPSVPGVPPPAAAIPIRAGYDGSSGYAPDLDTAPLTDRRIVLDPGHGGRWAGTRGAGGLTEAEVNLEVALELSTLLQRAGASVWLTRDADFDRTSPEDSSLAFDLKARARFADSLRAEVFLSLHHNADAAGRHDVNETQTYYRRGDDGPSLDPAQVLHRRLVQALRLEPTRLLAGNYSVLRNTRADAACLLEPSYLTFPATESLLRDTTAIRLEAESYFMGLLDYFSAGVPRVVSVGWDTLWTGSDAWRPIVARLSEAPLALDWLVDGERVESARLAKRAGAGESPEFVLAPAEPWRDGERTVSVRLRGQSGNHSAFRAETLAVELPPARLLLAAHPAAPTWGPVALTLTALDAWDRPLADTLRLAEVTWTSGEAAGAPGAPIAPGWESAGALRLYGAGDRPGLVQARWRGLASNTVRLEGPGGGAWRSGFARWAGRGSGVPGAVVLDPASGASAACDAAGFYALPGGAEGRAAPLEASAPGFTSLALDSLGQPLLSPLLGGALLGRRIAVDAIGGGENPDGQAPRGSVASPINLRVARLLRDFLVQAGAHVVLVRDSESALSDAERVERAERFAAERVVRIGRRSGGPSAIGSFPGSAGGERLARAVQRWLAAGEAAYAAAAGEDPPREAIRWEDASWVLQQTSCPAVSVRFGDFSREADEARFLAPAWQVREAYGICVALAAEMRDTVTTGTAMPALVAAEFAFTAAGAPARDLLVSLDGLALLTDGSGRAHFEGLDATVSHRLAVRWIAGTPEAVAWVDLRASRHWTWDGASPAPRRSDTKD